MATNPSAINFNGSNQYITLPRANATIQNVTSFTWQAWVKPRTVTDNANHMIWAERQGTGSFLRFGVTAYNAFTKSRPSYLKFLFGPKDGVAGTYYSYPVTWLDDRWHHIAFNALFSGPSYEIIYDGVMVVSGKLVLPAGTTAVSNTSPISVTAGAWDDRTLSTDPVHIKANSYWSGKLDDVNIYNNKQSSSQITSYITSKDFTNNSTTGLIWIYRFIEGTGEGTGSTTTAERQSGNTATLTQAGSASAALWTVDRPFIGNGLVDSNPPSNFTTLATPTTNITSTSFTANWNNTTDDVYVEYYELQTATVSNFSSFASYNTGRQTNWTPTALTPGTNYYWRVRAFDAAGNASAYSATVSVTTTASGDLTAPTTPTQNAATSIAFSGYTANWSAATDNVAVTGYKIDVATDSAFTNFLNGFRNRDVGNVLTYAISGTVGSTSYYSRIRAYDAVGNESPSSNVIKIITGLPPDTVAPDAVTMAPATSITAVSMTANWLPGVDNVGVVNYLLDVATDETFGTMIGAYNGLSVGNVIAYPLTGLLPDTSYSYRVRAVDAASNVSNNTDSPITSRTLPSSLLAGGNYSVFINPVQDAYVDSANATTNYGTLTTLLVAGNGTTATKLSFLEFDASQIIGTIQNAYLSLYVTASSASSITITGPTSSITFDQTTLTYNTRPSITGGTMVVNPLTAGQYLVVDVSSLMVIGNTQYTFMVSTTNNIAVSFSAVEFGLNPPVLQVDVDPTSGTLMSTLTATPGSGLETNYCINPGMDTNTTSWAALGTGATVSQNTSDQYWGAGCLQVVCDGTTNPQGVTYVGTATAAVVGQTWTISFYAKVFAGTLSAQAELIEFNNAGTKLTSSTLNITLTTTWRRFSITRTLSSGTVAFMGISLHTVANVSTTIRMDSVFYRQGSWEGGYFDGNTSGAIWNGTANNSTSSLGEGVFSLLSTYLGDANTNNTAYVQYKRSDQNDWNRRETIDAVTVVNHGTSQVTSTVGKSYGNVNKLLNPSLELDVQHWGTIGTGVTIQQDTTMFVGGSLPGVASGRADYTNAAGARTVYSTDMNNNAALGDTFTFSVYLAASVTSFVTLLISERDISGAILTDHQSTVQSVSAGFQRYSYTVTLTNASTAFVVAGFTYSTTSVASIWWDEAMLEKSQYLNPYIDGSMPDGLWEGNAHGSKTSIALSPSTSYDFQVTYTDPDGIIGQTDTTATIANINTTVSSNNIPVNITTTGTITLTASNNEIDASVTWTGDNNNNNVILFEWKRTDLAAWSTTTTTYDRVNLVAKCRITNLGPGISYTVRATFTDTDNASGTYGVNPLVAITNTTTTLLTPDASSIITFGGFMLMGRTDGIIAVTKHDAFGMPTRRIDIQDLARSDGAIEMSNFWGKRTISMSGVVSGTSRADLFNNLSILKKALAPKLQPLVINTMNNDGRYFTASLASFASAEQGGVNIMHMSWDAQFACADPFAYNINTQSTTFSASNNSTVNLTNNGDLSIDVSFTITTTATAATSVTIVNSTTGERLTPSQSLVSGDVMTIIGSTMSVKKNGVSSDYLGAFPKLSVGPNTFVFYTTPNASSITVAVSWQERYL